MKLKSLIFAAVLGIVPALGWAQSTITTPTTRVDARQAEQQRRINEGVASGQVNQAEQQRLQTGQAKVQRMEDKAKADGKITKKEATQIEHEQNRQSRRVYHEKHDKKTTANSTR